MQEYLNMFRYIVFSFLIADFTFNVEGYSSRAPITPEKEVGGNVYKILKYIISLNFCYLKDILFEIVICIHIVLTAIFRQLGDNWRTE